MTLTLGGFEPAPSGCKAVGLPTELSDASYYIKKIIKEVRCVKYKAWWLVVSPAIYDYFVYSKWIEKPGYLFANHLNPNKWYDQTRS